MNRQWSLIDEIRAEAKSFFSYVHRSIGNQQSYFLDNRFEDPISYFDKPSNINFPQGRNFFLSLIRNRIGIRYFKIDVIIPFLNEPKRTYFLVSEKGKNTTFKLGYIVNGYFKYKPYFSSQIYGILDKYVDEDSPFPDYIPLIFKDLNRLMTFSSKSFSVDDEDIIWDMMELFLIIITSERFRSDQSNLLSYSEFFKVKKLNDRDELIERIKKLFNPVDPDLKYPQRRNMNINNPVGGAENIVNTPPEYILESFMDIIYYVETPNCEWAYEEFAYDFYHKHLDRLEAIFENRYPNRCSNGYELVQQRSIRHVQIWATPISESSFNKCKEISRQEYILSSRLISPKCGYI